MGRAGFTFGFSKTEEVRQRVRLGRENSMWEGSETAINWGGHRRGFACPARSWALQGDDGRDPQSVFSSVPLLCSQQKTELPVTENVQTIPPPYVVRTILVYSRPPCQPQFSLTEPMKVTEAWERVVRH